jgi:hypothetical protein
MLPKSKLSNHEGTFNIPSQMSKAAPARRSEGFRRRPTWGDPGPTNDGATTGRPNRTLAGEGKGQRNTFRTEIATNLYVSQLSMKCA